MRPVGKGVVRRAPEGVGRLPGRTNYVIGNDPDAWRIGVPSYSRARYGDVYPGIDVIFHGRDGSMEYDFVVAPGADPGQIRLQFEGHKKLEVNSTGDLVISTRHSSLVQKRPFIYQVLGGKRHRIAGRFELRGATVRFALGRYDRSKRLIIDPRLTYSTYLGGLSDDAARGVATDDEGNIYLTGNTSSFNFPVSGTPPFQPSRRGLDDSAFVSKIDAGGKLVYSTYLGGGSGATWAQDVQAGPDGEAFVMGNTQALDFYVTPDAFQTSPSTVFGDMEVFVTRFGSDGLPRYSTYFGGGGTDGVSFASGGIAVTPPGVVAIAGLTSGWNDAPETPEDEAFPLRNGFQNTFGGGVFDAFVAVLDTTVPGSNSLRYSSYLGGKGNEASRVQIARDSVSGKLFVVGATTGPDFPVKASFQPQFGGGPEDGFVCSIDPSKVGAQSLVSCSFLGGPKDDALDDVAVGRDGLVSVIGSNVDGGFPAKNAYQPLQGGGSDLVVASIDPALPPEASVIYATYLGGSGQEGRTYASIDEDESGSIYITGETDSVDNPATASNEGFPLVRPFQPQFGGSCGSFTCNGDDAFVAKLNPRRSGAGFLLFSSYLGGPNGENGTAIAGDEKRIVVAGRNGAGNFPMPDPDRAAQRQSGGSGDAFVAVVEPVLPIIDSVRLVSGGPAEGGLAGGAEVVIKGENFNEASRVRFGESESAPDAVAPAFISPTEIRVLSPPSSTPGPVDIRVTTPEGTSEVRRPNDVFTYLAPAVVTPELPILDLLQPQEGPVSGGTEVAIKGRRFDDVRRVDFGGQAISPASFVSASGSEIRVKSPAVSAPGPVPVTVTTGAGGSNARAFTYTTTSLPPAAPPPAREAAQPFSANLPSGQKALVSAPPPGTGFGAPQPIHAPTLSTAPGQALSSAPAASSQLQPVTAVSDAIPAGAPAPLHPPVTSPVSGVAKPDATEAEPAPTIYSMVGRSGVPFVLLWWFSFPMAALWMKWCLDRCVSGTARRRPAVAPACR